MSASSSADAVVLPSEFGPEFGGMDADEILETLLLRHQEGEPSATIVAHEVPFKRQPKVKFMPTSRAGSKPKVAAGPKSAVPITNAPAQRPPAQKPQQEPITIIIDHPAQKPPAVARQPPPLPPPLAKKAKSDSKATLPVSKVASKPPSIIPKAAPQFRLTGRKCHVCKCYTYVKNGWCTNPWCGRNW